jgi:hypothetical protein
MNVSLSCFAFQSRAALIQSQCPVSLSGTMKVPEATVHDLADCDGLAIGTPVYWGGMSYATKVFLDSAAKLWDLTAPDKPVQTAPISLENQLRLLLVAAAD